MCFDCCKKVRMFLRCPVVSEVLELDQHGQGTLKLAIKVRFVARKLLQPIGLKPFTKGLIDDGIVVAGLFFLGVTHGKQVFVDESLQTINIGGVRPFFQIDFPPLPRVGQQCA